MKNVILIMVDQWRGDCLSIDGHPVVHTPFLDELALRGVRFRHAYSATPTCIPARAALMTGLSARNHGRVGYQDGVDWTYPTTLAGEFTRQGYQTQAVGKMHVWPVRNRLGFDNVILHDGYLPYSRRHHPDIETMDDYVPWMRNQLGYPADDIDHGVHCNSWVARPWDKPEHVHPTNFVTTQAVQFLKRRDPTKPFFLYMSYHRPHPPFDPPQWAFDQYQDREMPDPPVGDWVTELHSEWRQRNNPPLGAGHPEAFIGQLSEVNLRRARAGYYGLMTHIDHQIKRLIDHLIHHNLYDNTVICFVSDHGEMMGDHHMLRKGYPYMGSIRIPFIYVDPTDDRIPTGTVRDEVVELRDVMPSLLDSAGLEIPDTLDGQSILPRIHGQSSKWRDALHGEHILFGESIQWLTNGREKYIWSSKTGREQFFNLDDDPQETRNLAGQPVVAPRLNDWRQRLIEALSDRDEQFTDGHQLLVDQPVQATLPSILSNRKV
ncbi:MAG: arylsulfatase [Anaerolineaceae bacterium]|nr:arylsulfatase [Anaerolineaceae bacterium]